MVKGYKVVKKAYSMMESDKEFWFSSKHKASQFAMSQCGSIEVYRCYDNGSECKIPWDYREYSDDEEYEAC
jgi:hypothetical protein